MNKKNTIFTLILFLILTLFSCQKNQTTKTQFSNPGVCVSFCIDILGDDEPIFTKPVMDTLLAIEKKESIVLLKEYCADKSEYSEKLSLCATKSNLIICGPLMAEELNEVAPLYPDKFFLILDYPGQGKNISSVLFKEDEMAKRAMSICYNNSKTKKIGAIFRGDPSDALSLVLMNILKPGRVDFVPLGSNSKAVLEKLKDFEKEGIDFVFIDRSPYLEEVITTLSKNKEVPFQIVCPRILVPDDSYLVFATIEKNYQPILSKIIHAFVRKDMVSKTYLVSDFGSVLTR